MQLIFSESQIKGNTHIFLVWYPWSLWYGPPISLNLQCSPRSSPQSFGPLVQSTNLKNKQTIQFTKALLSYSQLVSQYLPHLHMKKVSIHVILSYLFFISKDRAVEIPCPTCPTWSHFIQDKLKISIYLSLDKSKIYYKVNKILYFIFWLIIMCSHVAMKTVWILISWLL